ncbi:hypothetical protein BDV24DRAFT_168436 [Aspergillus arachidicola]|uniref:Uncharacterized protein n=1 Tax=Aspergillus arachidicola TaxID=656916 RepID=A0A5N6XVD9_9EURO|nr:hypothetical protein BDV24DRAFT_168436 [Aspergillus arachidicola]
MNPSVDILKQEDASEMGFEITHEHGNLRAAARGHSTSILQQDTWNVSEHQNQIHPKRSEHAFGFLFNMELSALFKPVWSPGFVENFINTIEPILKRPALKKVQLFLDPALATSLIALKARIDGVALASPADSIPSKSNEYVSISEFQELLPSVDIEQLLDHMTVGWRWSVIRNTHEARSLDPD